MYVMIYINTPAHLYLYDHAPNSRKKIGDLWSPPGQMLHPCPRLAAAPCCEHEPEDRKWTPARGCQGAEQRISPNKKIWTYNPN